MTRSALSTLAYEALVRARRKFSNREERCIRETWTAEQELVLLRLYPDMPNEVLVARLNKTLQQICSKAYRLGLKKSPEFSKKIRQDWGSATRFKKGQKPHTWLPVGSTRISADGYLQRKISDTGYPPRDWKGIHILLWEEHFGPIPTGHCVCFKDNNKQNVVIDNLELITRAERMRRNSIHRYPPELKSAIRVISKLKRTIQEVEHEEQD
ncbi:HNH endonuclease signature motif containing protein [Pseudomonas aeruginosa]|uniref:HNH endonuclease signature motif containing protein n=1 Tax=Pseudomonas aeruginosa TaxID=287 RepID=UPI001A25DDEF|nr:HNH endonuclease [Pseudomonas aeruginosa]EKU0594485.1 HNH endonuclease [Pseudomonas aeruginosa]EKV1242898.1 HNH endonuclease [Pseudomonas aeruginosa]EKV8587933.1 HNH endonuclease [Pseudomonas aeruginosa]ELA3748743.1 HNH endonuclease [Pseudomonas aeruginosa]